MGSDGNLLDRGSTDSHGCPKHDAYLHVLFRSVLAFYGIFATGPWLKNELGKID